MSDPPPPPAHTRNPNRFNQFLAAVGNERQVWSFGAELADGVAWCTLLNAIDPAACPPPDERDAEANAASAVEAAHKMEVKVRRGCGVSFFLFLRDGA